MTSVFVHQVTLYWGEISLSGRGHWAVSHAHVAVVAFSINWNTLGRVRFLAAPRMGWAIVQASCLHCRGFLDSGQDKLKETNFCRSDLPLLLRESVRFYISNSSRLEGSEERRHVLKLWDGYLCGKRARGLGWLFQETVLKGKEPFLSIPPPSLPLLSPSFC